MIIIIVIIRTIHINRSILIISESRRARSLIWTSPPGRKVAGGRWPPCGQSVVSRSSCVLSSCAFRNLAHAMIGSGVSWDLNRFAMKCRCKLSEVVLQASGSTPSRCVGKLAARKCFREVAADSFVHVCFNHLHKLALCVEGSDYNFTDYMFKTLKP